MAKSAKATAEVDISDRMVNKFVRDMLEQYELIESARGSYMNKARRHRETMTTVLEGLAARGVPQKVGKLHIKIIQAQGKLKDMLAELDAEERKIAHKMAKAQGKSEQLALFKDLPPAEAAPEVEAKEPKEPKPKKQPGATGKDINDALGGEPAGTA
ncbi:MAG: hypothetical protein V4773_16615 [Verrucomicrobiota bacterium]